MSSDSPGNDPKGKKSARKIRGSRFVANWLEVDASLIQRAIDAATSNGGAIRFGYTRDGGAYAIGILGDGEPYTLFSGGNDDVERTLKEIQDNLG